MSYQLQESGKMLPQISSSIVQPIIQKIYLLTIYFSNIETLCFRKWLNSLCQLMVIKNCFLALTLANGNVFRLNHPIVCESLDSFSSIQAISNYLIKEVPHILPPMSHTFKVEAFKHITSHYNPFFQVWNDHIKNCIIQGMGYRKGNELFIQVPIDDQGQKIRQSKFEEKDVFSNEVMGYTKRLQRIFQLEPIQYSNKKIGIYLMHATKPEKMYAPRLNITAILLGALYHNQKWMIFDIPNGKIPTIEELKTFDAVLITGGSYSAIQKPQNVAVAIDRLGKAYIQSNHLKIVATCYGHQLICQYFGGRLSKRQTTAGLQKIIINQDCISRHKCLSRLRNVSSLILSQYHEEYVKVLPEQFQLLGRSESCEIQSIISRDERILSCQFHCELTFDFVQSLMSQQKALGPCNWEYNLNESKIRIESSVQDSKIFLEVISQFMNN